MIFIWRVFSSNVHTSQSAKAGKMFNFPLGSLWFGKVKWLRSKSESELGCKSRISSILSSLSFIPKNEQEEIHCWIMTFQLISHKTAHLKFTVIQWEKYHLYFTDKETQTQELTFQGHWLEKCSQANVKDSYLILSCWNSEE